MSAGRRRRGGRWCTGTCLLSHRDMVLFRGLHTAGSIPSMCRLRHRMRKAGCGAGHSSCRAGLAACWFPRGVPWVGAVFLPCRGLSRSTRLYCPRRPARSHIRPSGHWPRSSVGPSSHRSTCHGRRTSLDMTGSAARTRGNSALSALPGCWPVLIDLAGYAASTGTLLSCRGLLWGRLRRTALLRGILLGNALLEAVLLGGGLLAALMGVACGADAGAVPAARRPTASRPTSAAAGRRVGRGTPAAAARGLPNRLCDLGSHAAYHHISKRTGEADAQIVSGDGRVKPDAGHNSIRFLRHLYNGHNQNHPGKYVKPAGDGGENRQKHFEENHVERHQDAHGAKHPAPAGEDFRGVSAAAHGERQRRRNGQHGEDHITLRDL